MVLEFILWTIGGAGTAIPTAYLLEPCMKSQKNKNNTTKQNKDETMKFMIIARYFFYAGTLTDKKNGALRNYYSKKIMEFDSRKKALEYIKENLCFEKCFKLSKNTYTFGGEYTAIHGEYSAPTYTITRR